MNYSNIIKIILNSDIEDKAYLISQVSDLHNYLIRYVENPDSSSLNLALIHQVYLGILESVYGPENWIMGVDNQEERLSLHNKAIEKLQSYKLVSNTKDIEVVIKGNIKSADSEIQVRTIILLSTENLRNNNYKILEYWKRFFITDFAINQWDISTEWQYLSDNDRKFLFVNYLRSLGFEKIKTENLKAIQQYCLKQNDKKSTYSILDSEFIKEYQDLTRSLELSISVFDEERAIKKEFHSELKNLSNENLKLIRIKYFNHRNKFVNFLDEGLFTFDETALAKKILNEIEDSNLSIQELKTILNCLFKYEFHLKVQK